MAVIKTEKDTKAQATNRTLRNTLTLEKMHVYILIYAPVHAELSSI
jgi:hypothetical protein